MGNPSKNGDLSVAHIRRKKTFVYSTYMQI